MNENEVIKELEKLRDMKDYSKSKDVSTGYREAMLDAIDLVKKSIENQKSKVIKTIKKIHKLENNHFEKAVFCRDHNMDLDNIKHLAIEREMRKVIRLIEDEFDTGHIPIEESK
jgi:hypothetical protein